MMEELPCVVMRRPTIMEDEGAHTLVNTFGTRKEAEEWIARQAGQYFTPGDYYILESCDDLRRQRDHAEKHVEYLQKKVKWIRAVLRGKVTDEIDPPPPDCGCSIRE